jgi:hypothetical protein
LLLLVVALVARRRPPAPAEQDALRRLLWLLPALAVLTLLAISNFPDIAGHALPRLPLPRTLAPALDMIRASGRLFWPAAYVLVLVALLAAYRLPGAQAGRILAALFALQLLDLSGMFAAIRATSAEAGAYRLYARTPDPRWDAAVAAARDVTFTPPDATRDLALFQEVAWRAARQRRPVRIVYAARNSLATEARLRAEDADYHSGRLAPDRFYILLDGAPVPQVGQSRLAVIDGVRVLLPVSARH